jgi:hypothetical protein
MYSMRGKIARNYPEANGHPLPHHSPHVPQKGTSAASCHLLTSGALSSFKTSSLHAIPAFMAATSAVKASSNCRQLSRGVDRSAELDEA